MEHQSPPHQVYLLVCTRNKSNKACCANAGDKLFLEIKSQLKHQQLNKYIRVLSTSCQQLCEKGPSVIHMPLNITYTNVKSSDIKSIIDKAQESIIAPSPLGEGWGEA
jgi:hypothetical protein